MSGRLASIRTVCALAMAAIVAAALVYALPALAQEPDDGTRDGAVSLGEQSPERGVQYFDGYSLDRANGDGVDYYTFSTDGRYQLGLGVRGQSIDLLAHLEDADGNEVAESGPPKDLSKDQSIEWLLATIDAGTWYIRVEAQADGETDYYLRFGLQTPPNSPPVFGSASYAFSVAEDAGVGEAVGSISATDADGDTLSYSITAGNEDGKFAINAGTGAITVAGTLDYETTSSYTLTVQTDDGNGGQATAAVNITVTDVDENSPPEFGSASYEFIVAEEVAVGTAVGTVSATDADNDTLSYGITAGGGDGKFAIDGTTGAVTVAAPLDYETTASYALTVRASDGKGGTADATVNITITDVVEDPDGTRAGAESMGTQSPDKGRQFFRDKSLNRAGGDAVDYYAFTTDGRYTLGLGVRDQSINLDCWLEDADGNTVIQSGPPADPTKDQSIEWLTATIAAGTYYIRVEAMEDGQTDYYLRFGLETPTNTAPEFGNASYAFSVAEDAGVGDAVGAVSATDADNNTLTYAITAGNGDGRFAINGGTGAITVAAALDYETTASYTLTVRADDGNSGTTTATATVSVTEVNENSPPVFGSFSYDFSIAEDASVGDAVGSVSATDPDSDTVSYAITVGNGDGKFALDGSTGAITVAGTLDHETASSHALTVEAADGHGGTATAAVEIAVSAVSAPPTSTALERLLTAGSASAVDTGTTPDGVSYIRFLESAPTPVPQPLAQSRSFAQGGGDSVGRMAPQSDGDPISVNPGGSLLLPQGLWSDGTTLWVSARGATTTADEKLYAYTLDGGARDDGKDIGLDVPDLPAPGNVNQQRGGANGVWMTGDTVWAASNLTPAVLAYHRETDTADPSTYSAGDRKSGEDFTKTTLDDQGNGVPLGLWSDGTNMYVADYDDAKVYVYGVSGKSHVKTIDTLSAAGNDKPVGLWSDGTTLWVSDHLDAKVYAYALATGVRDAAMDIGSLSSENSRPQGMWSDGKQMWVVDKYTNKVFVYGLPTHTRLGSLEVSGVNLRGFRPGVTEYARNVAGDITQVTVAAAAQRAGATVEIKPDDAEENTEGHQVNLVQNGVTTITVKVTHRSDSRTYTLKLTQLSGTMGTLSDDATLSALSLTGVTLSPAFASGVTEYRYVLTDAQLTNGLTATVTATPNNAQATVIITPADGDSATGHQVKTAGSGISVIVTVAAQDGSDARTYTVYIRSIIRIPDKDISMLTDSTVCHEAACQAYDIWSDGETMWVVLSGEPRKKILAYDMGTGERRNNLDYQNWYDQDTYYFGQGLWSDGDTIWIPDLWRYGNTTIDAIDAQSHDPAKYVSGQSFVTRDEAKSIGTSLRAGPRDLWSDGETIWVAFIEDWKTTLAGGGLKAYNFADKARNSAKDITIGTTGKVRRDWREPMSFAIWSDGTILWVVSNNANARSRLEAHKLADGSRLPGMDILTGADGLTHPRGMWSDGRTMWVLNNQRVYVNDDGRYTVGIHAYRLTPNAKLFSLAMSGVDFGHFIHGRPKYAAEVANDVDETTVFWEQAHTGGSAAVAISAVGGGTTTTTDADTNTDGYQVNLAEGENVITITVTAPNGTDTYAYTVTITRASS